jgi:phosphate transport system substrate-binding protein
MLRRVATLAILSLSLAAGAGLSAQSLSYVGSDAIKVGIIEEASKVFQKKTGASFTVIDGELGQAKGFKAMEEGKFTVVGMTRLPNAEEKKAKPFFKVIGYDGLAVAVNAKNPVKNLTKEQMKGIYTGKVTNWKQVGGPDVAVTVYVDTTKSATPDQIKATINDGAPLGPVKGFASNDEPLAATGTDLGGIYVTSLLFAEASKAVHVVSLDGVSASLESIRNGDYILTRPLALVSAAAPTGELKAFFDFIASDEGQKIVSKEFVALK